MSATVRRKWPAREADGLCPTPRSPQDSRHGLPCLKTSIAPPRASSVRSGWAILLCGCALALVAISALIPLWGMWVVDNGSRYLQMRAIGGADASGGFSIAYPAQPADPQFALHPSFDNTTFVREGRLYSQYPPSFAAVAAVARRVMGDAAMRVLPMVGALLLVAACRLLAGSLRLRHPNWVATGVLFATPLLPYAFVFWDILPAAGFGVMALALAVRAAEHRDPRIALAAGACAAVAFILREEYLVWGGLLCMALALEARRQPRVWVSALAAFTLPAAVLMALNQSAIGSPLFVYTYVNALENPIFRWSLDTRFATAYLFLARAWGGMPQVPGGMELLDIALLAMLCAMAGLAARRDWVRVAACAAALCAAAAVRWRLWDFAEPFVAQRRVISLAACAPFVFAGFARLGAGAQDAPRAIAARRMMLVVPVAFIAVMLASSAMVAAVGFHWGPRLLLPAVAVLAVRGFAALGDALARTGGAERRALGVLAALCVAVGAADSAVYLERLHLKARLGAELEAAIRAAAPPGTPDRHQRMVAGVRPAEDLPRLPDARRP